MQDQKLQYQRVQPQATQIEKAVLGAIMLEKGAFETVADILSAEYFYDNRHVYIFEACADLSSNQRPIDLLTVAETLRTSQRIESAGGAAYLAELTSMVGSAANIEYHSRIIQQKYIRRECIRAGHEIVGKGYNESVDDLDLVNYMEGELFRLTGSVGGRQFQSAGRLIADRRARIKAIEESPDEMIGTPTGFAEIDRVMSGLLPGKLQIWAGRPGMGKSAFVKSCIRRMSVHRGIPTGLFSLEMTGGEVVDRIISEEAALEVKKVKDPRKCSDIENFRLAEAEKHVEIAPFYIDDTPGISIMHLRSKARKMVREYGVKVIFVDYLQLMEDDGKFAGSREQEVSRISRSLKGLAKELDIPVIALSQLSRAVEQRGGMKRPQLSDLRESGSLEQDADLVAFFYRPEYYGIKEDADGAPLVKGLTEFIIAKHRDGDLLDIDLIFVAYLTMFRDYETGDDFADLDDDNSDNFTFGGKTTNADDDLPF